jgi:hypothetical protein
MSEQANLGSTELSPEGRLERNLLDVENIAINLAYDHHKNNPAHWYDKWLPGRAQYTSTVSDPEGNPAKPEKPIDYQVSYDRTSGSPYWMTVHFGAQNDKFHADNFTEQPTHLKVHFNDNKIVDSVEYHRTYDHGNKPSLFEQMLSAKTQDLLTRFVEKPNGGHRAAVLTFNLDEVAQGLTVQLRKGAGIANGIGDKKYVGDETYVEKRGRIGYVPSGGGFVSVVERVGTWDRTAPLHEAPASLSAEEFREFLSGLLEPAGSATPSP